MPTTLRVLLLLPACTTAGVTEGWRLQSSAHLAHASGQEISQPGYDASGWHALHLFPTTVIRQQHD